MMNRMRQLPSLVVYQVPTHTEFYTVDMANPNLCVGLTFPPAQQFRVYILWILNLQKK
jgi:hypothetical protein